MRFKTNDDKVSTMTLLEKSDAPSEITPTETTSKK